MKESKSTYIYSFILEQIQVGILKVGDKLMSERDMMVELGVSRTPIRKALELLEKDGFIIKKTGAGSFVNEPIFNQKIDKFYSFTNEMKKRNKIPTSKILSFGVIKKKFKNDLNPRDYYKVERVRMADDIPLMYGNTYIACEMLPDLTKEILEKKPFYEILGEKYNVFSLEAEQKFKPTLMTRVEGVNLEKKEGALGIYVERFLFNKNEILEYSKSVVCGDKFEFSIKY